MASQAPKCGLHEMNAILCAAGHNLRKILGKLRLFYAQQIGFLERMIELALPAHQQLLHHNLTRL
ncbi:MAG: hypothetical protein QM533_13505 [Cytophagales bacterium]|nr:hypothetical protein [Cytophagales bacterium]